MYNIFAMFYYLNSGATEGNCNFGVSSILLAILTRGAVCLLQHLPRSGLHGPLTVSLGSLWAHILVHFLLVSCTGLMRSMMSEATGLTFWSPFPGICSNREELDAGSFSRLSWKKNRQLDTNPFLETNGNLSTYLAISCVNIFNAPTVTPKQIVRRR